MEKKRKWKELRTSNSQGLKSGNSKMATFPRHRCLHGKFPPPHYDHQGSHPIHLDATTKTIEPGAIFARESHKCFAFESFVFKTMLEGFDSPNFRVAKDSDLKILDLEQYLSTFKTLESAHPKSFLAQNPRSFLARFTRTKYLNLVQAKMEYSFFWELEPKKASYLRWVKKDYSFLEIYMENVIGDSFLSGKINNGNVNVRVNFTVVPSQSMGDELVVEDGRVCFDFDEVNGYGGNLDDNDAAEGVGHRGVDVVEA
ncbi:hypothetical protein GOBAR_DD22151 [Gossypium barbadense]|nr:hypothetical protein GOBAR_DD22151 [Gossypium barbadense]